MENTLKKSNRMDTKKMVVLAMMTAIAYVSVFIFRIPVVLFLKYEPKDVIITIGGFLFGPLASMLMSAVVSLVEMVTISGTGPIGALMNFLSTVSFACTAAIMYKKVHTITGALIGLVTGSVVIFSFSVINVVGIIGTGCCFRSFGFTFVERRSDMNAVAIRVVAIIFFIMTSFPVVVLGLQPKDSIIRVGSLLPKSINIHCNNCIFSHLRFA